MRKRLRLPGYDYSENSAYFVTVCTHRRRGILNGDVAALVVSELFGLEGRFGVTLDYHVVMPDHLHAMLFLSSGGATLSEVVGAFKSLVVVQIRRRSLVYGPIWQRGFYDHVVRSDEDLRRIREYVQNNPVADALERGFFEPARSRST